ncbi:hypothetical protein Rhopal_007817-T1 [Rhodotorula paludigena]|uniref:Ubiquitin-like domain-containing protein n=1 Tax=Rhodotorula paludigena TaxID=86838 RepID=A0AAV5GQ60_9BASI|nr:hypothetical protein Rhopal_007817-T1 [Rhodotorula paludigena]
MPSIPDSLYLRHGDVTYLLQRPLNHSELCAQARRLFSIELETVIHLERLVDEIGAVRITSESWALDTAQTKLCASPALYILVVERSESAEEGDDDDETLSDLGALNWDDCRASLLSGIMTPGASVASSVQETIAAEEEEEPAPKALQRTDVPTSSIVDFERCFTLNARLSSGRDIAIPVHPLCRIHELKAYIAVREDLSLVEQNLVWAGSVLENDRTAASYGLTRSSILHVVQRTSESEYW